MLLNLVRTRYSYNMMNLFRYFLSISLLFCLLLQSCSNDAEDVVWVARDSKWYSMELMGKGDNLLGFTDELLDSVGKAMDLHIELVYTSVSGLYIGLEEKNFDVIITSDLPSTLNRTRYTFSDPYFVFGPILVTRQDATYTSLADMDNRVIGISTGMSLNFTKNLLMGVSLVPYENILFALENLANHEIDGVVMDSMLAHVYTSSFYAGRLKIVPPPLNAGGLRLVAPKNKKGEQFIQQFNEKLLEIKGTGKYKELIEKWALFDAGKQIS